MPLNVGALAALGTASAWTVTAIVFEYAGKRVGALVLNLLRLALGCLFLGIYGLLVRGLFFPIDAAIASWAWLGVSGFVGFVIGDLFLIQAYIEIGARLSVVVYATAPIFTAILGLAVFGERLGLRGLGGMALTLVGIAIAVLSRNSEHRGVQGAASFWSSGRLRGALLAVGGAVGQAGGLILAKLGATTNRTNGDPGIASMNPFAGTQIRVIAGLVGFAIVITATGSWRGVARGLKDMKAMAGLGIGAFFGPFLGVSLSLLAVQSGNTGVASAIMSIVPVLIIAPSAIFFKERVTLREVLGSAVAVAGVFLLFTA